MADIRAWLSGFESKACLPVGETFCEGLTQCWSFLEGDRLDVNICFVQFSDSKYHTFEFSFVGYFPLLFGHLMWDLLF
jgi:hypothetical protein